MSLWTDAVDDAIRGILRRHLAKHKGNKSATARTLGMDRSDLLRRLKRYGVK